MAVHVLHDNHRAATMPKGRPGVKENTRAETATKSGPASGSRPPKGRSQSASGSRPTKVRSQTESGSRPPKVRFQTASKSPSSKHKGTQLRPETVTKRTGTRSQSPANHSRSRPGTVAIRSRPNSAGGGGKKKLKIRGLRHFVKSHKRREQDDHGGPHLWRREFPYTSKFHPDKYIYDFDEGPNAAPRPVSAMARCKKHGGRCRNCGICTSDLCSSCRKCELDCICPKQPVNPIEAYKDVFGGDTWRKTCKVICDLTEKDKKNPVGGNGQKYMNIRNRQTNNLYQSQIDVLNPHGIPLTDSTPPSSSSTIHTTPQFPMASPYSMFPPMYPQMPFMPFPMMTMAPPMMPMMYPPLPPCPAFDPYYSPPSLGSYPNYDSSLPMQNYSE